MTSAEKKVVQEIIAKAWDDGFEHCRIAASLICTAQGRPDLAAQIQLIPLHLKTDG
jgi:hypothetical protein